jgi:hypothetical protein
LNSNDIRDVLAIAKLAHSIEDVSWLVQTFKKYGSIPGGVDNPAWRDELMEFEIPNRSNWKKRHKLVGIGLVSTSLILTFVTHTS